MAGGENHSESESDSIASKSGNVGESIVYYKCHPKSVAKTVYCISCHAIQHRSCAERSAVNFVSETAINCCGGNVDKCDKDKERLEMQVELLNRLIDEMRDKNEVLKLNNGLLLQRIQYLEESRNVKKNVNKQVAKFNSEQKSLLSTSGSSRYTGDKERQQYTSSTYSEVVQTPLSPMELGARGPQNVRGIRDKTAEEPACHVDAASNVRTVDQGGVSLTERRNRNHNNENNESVVVVSGNGSQNVPCSSEVYSKGYPDRYQKDADGFTIPRRQRRKLKKRLGTDEQSCDGEEGFTGGDRKVWLYIYRVKRHVMPQMIVDYIMKKPGFESVLVDARELPSDPSKLKCFVVTAPLKFKDEMYQSSFWPQNVGIKRFKFELHREFLQSGADFL